MKGQTETIGLVIIVVLVILLFLFAFVFMSKKEVESNAFLSVKADNMINAITKAEINGKRIEEQVSSCCEGSCEEFSREIESILDNSLEEDYILSISKEGNVCESIGVCREGIASSSYRLRSNGENYEISVELC